MLSDGLRILCIFKNFIKDFIDTTSIPNEPSALVVFL